ncbi:hypothetical protein BDN71DRAFT_1433667 [Pleurotus eryngii]|uniref:Uncharacterized protein n=1 Tax=Pleurotus eryngii TaxID=5323 RepID=A0A9P5ZQW6_PLEER|nr:hypothetical protein BDN71DRAFT_1433667 [Pleurotus eryngii]
MALFSSLLVFFGAWLVLYAAPHRLVVTVLFSRISSSVSHCNGTSGSALVGECCSVEGGQAGRATLRLLHSFRLVIRIRVAKDTGIAKVNRSGGWLERAPWSEDVSKHAALSFVFAEGLRLSLSCRRHRHYAAQPLARIKGSGRNGFAPLPGEQPVAICRLQVLGCTDVLTKDSKGFSDPVDGCSHDAGDWRTTAG